VDPQRPRDDRTCSRYNLCMPDFHFSHPIEVRYGDLDPQGHVNNAKYLTYLEQARVIYFQRLELWQGKSFMDIGVILADAQITFRKPILYRDEIQVGVKITRLGNKSMTVEQQIEGIETGENFASATIVLVAFDYHQQATIQIPEGWRTIIQNFEGLEGTPQ
jgi:acyl-CoA thioester hydrolase